MSRKSRAHNFAGSANHENTSLFPQTVGLNRHLFTSDPEQKFIKGLKKSGEFKNLTPDQQTAYVVFASIYGLLGVGMPALSGSVGVQVDGDRLGDHSDDSIGQAHFSRGNSGATEAVSGQVYDSRPFDFIEPAAYKGIKTVVDVYSRVVDPFLGDTNRAEVQSMASELGINDPRFIKEGLSGIAQGATKMDEKNGIAPSVSLFKLVALANHFTLDEETNTFTHRGFEVDQRGRKVMVKNSGWTWEQVRADVFNPANMAGRLKAAINNNGFWEDPPKAPPVSTNEPEIGPDQPNVVPSETPIPEASLQLINSDVTPDVVNDFWMAINLSVDANGDPAFADQIANGLEKSDVTILAMGTESSGNYFASFTDTVTGEERLAVKRGDGKWIELKKVFDPGTFNVQWLNLFAGTNAPPSGLPGVATPSPSPNGIPYPDVVVQFNLAKVLGDPKADLVLKFTPPAVPGEPYEGVVYDIVLKGDGKNFVEENVANLWAENGLGFENRGEKFELVFKPDPLGVGVVLPNARFDENGFTVLPVGEGLKPINVPLADVDKRVVKKDGVLFILDENEKPIAFFDPQTPESGFVFFDTPDALSKLTDEQKLALSPDMIVAQVADENGEMKEINLEKSNVSTVKPELVIYRDESGNAQMVHNLATGEQMGMREVGIVELDLVDGGKLEVRAFSDAKECLDFIAENAMRFSGDKINFFAKHPELNEAWLDLKEKHLAIAAFNPKWSGVFPSYPGSEEFFFINVGDYGSDASLLAFLNKERVGVDVFLESPSQDIFQVVKENWNIY